LNSHSIARSSKSSVNGKPVPIPILSIQPGDSPRLKGEERAHIARLVESDARFPPILVDKSTMRVIDGMHRLMAASLLGRTTIDVIFFEGNAIDVFLRAVQENVAHGLPLSQADRRAAAERVIRSHPHMSDRVIGEATGLSAGTVAGIRHSSGEGSQSDARVGKDGRTRRLNVENGRRRAAEILANHPDARLREIAKAVGISPATVLDVRNRLARGESPVPGKLANLTLSCSKTHADAPESPQEMPLSGRPSAGLISQAPSGEQTAPSTSIVDRLVRDPSLRNNDSGRQLLRMLRATADGAELMSQMPALIPPHCVLMIEHVARQYAQQWQSFATELNRRGRIIDPSRH
jgi:hypothetical protein